MTTHTIEEEVQYDNNTTKKKIEMKKHKTVTRLTGTIDKNKFSIFGEVLEKKKKIGKANSHDEDISTELRHFQKLRKIKREPIFDATDNTVKFNEIKLKHLEKQSNDAANIADNTKLNLIDIIDDEEDDDDNDDDDNGDNNEQNFTEKVNQKKLKNTIYSNKSEEFLDKSLSKTYVADESEIYWSNKKEAKTIVTETTVAAAEKETDHYNEEEQVQLQESIEKSKCNLIDIPRNIKNTEYGKESKESEEKLNSAEELVKISSSSIDSKSSTGSISVTGLGDENGEKGKINQNKPDKGRPNSRKGKQKLSYKQLEKKEKLEVEEKARQQSKSLLRSAFLVTDDQADLEFRNGQPKICLTDYEDSWVTVPPQVYRRKSSINLPDFDHVLLNKAELQMQACEESLEDGVIGNEPKLEMNIREIIFQDNTADEFQLKPVFRKKRKDSTGKKGKRSRNHSRKNSSSDQEYSPTRSLSMGLDMSAYNNEKICRTPRDYEDEKDFDWSCYDTKIDQSTLYNDHKEYNDSKIDQSTLNNNNKDFEDSKIEITNVIRKLGYYPINDDQVFEPVFDENSFKKDKRSTNLSATYQKMDLLDNKVNGSEVQQKNDVEKEETIALPKIKRQKRMSIGDGNVKQTSNNSSAENRQLKNTAISHKKIVDMESYSRDQTENKTLSTNPSKHKQGNLRDDDDMFDRAIALSGKKSNQIKQEAKQKEKSTGITKTENVREESDLINKDQLNQSKKIVSQTKVSDEKHSALVKLDNDALITIPNEVRTEINRSKTSSTSKAWNLLVAGNEKLETQTDVNNELFLVETEVNCAKTKTIEPDQWILVARGNDGLECEDEWITMAQGSDVLTAGTHSLEKFKRWSSGFDFSEIKDGENDGNFFYTANRKVWDLEYLPISKEDILDVDHSKKFDEMYQNFKAIKKVTYLDSGCKPKERSHVAYCIKNVTHDLIEKRKLLEKLLF